MLIKKSNEILRLNKKLNNRVEQAIRAAEILIKKINKRYGW